MAFRKGQWVKLRKDMRLEDGKELAGTVGIYQGPATQQTPQGLVPVVGFAEVHLVTFPEGETRKKIGIRPTDLEPVLTREEIPAHRLLHTPKEWIPLP